MGFEYDLVRGKEVEERLLNIIQKKYPDAVGIDGYCKEWDIYIPSLDAGVEVKYDPMSQDTGNIVVEVEYNGKPSALTTTKSRWWVVHTGNEMILTTPARIQYAIKSRQLTKKTFTGAGDTHPKQAYLVKVNTLKHNALKVVTDIIHVSHPPSQGDAPPNDIPTSTELIAYSGPPSCCDGRTYRK